MSTKSFEKLFQEAEKHEDYWIAETVLELTETITDIMDGDGISRSELARRLGTSPAYVTKLLRGNANFTLQTLHRLAKALDADLRIQFTASADATSTPKRRPRQGNSDSRPSAQAMVAAPRQA